MVSSTCTQQRLQYLGNPELRVNKAESLELVAFEVRENIGGGRVRRGFLHLQALELLVKVLSFAGVTL